MNIEDPSPQAGKIEISLGYVFTALFATGVFLVSIIWFWLRQTPKLPSVSSSQSWSPLVRETARRRHGARATRRISGAPSAFQSTALIEDGEEDSDAASDTSLIQAPDDGPEKKKIGVKKMAKLEAKAERRAAREAMLLEREEKRKKQEQLDELRRIEEEKEKQEEEAQAERERQEREEKARKEQEEYEKITASFDVEEEGYDEETQSGEMESKKLEAFIDYVNEKKVVLMEDLAAEFKMRTKDVIDRIQKLMAGGQLVGIIDDRGKFISVTREELESVAKFIRQRGRVSISEIVVNSNKLINLKPTQSSLTT
ncbi:DDRGK domain-containing protein 1, partial [Fragariocoptes setiger]